MNHFVDVDGALAAYNERNPTKPLTRKQAAALMGVSYQTLVNWQNGRSPVVLEPVAKLLEVTGCRLEEIVKPFKTKQ